MTEPNLSGGAPDSAAAQICPWCSASLTSGQEETCPCCGASLHEVAASEVPGVTRVDHEAILKARMPPQRGRGLMGWLSGEYEAGAPPGAHGSIAPPEEAVRREMLRLELAALEAEAQARQAEEAAEVAATQVSSDEPTDGEPAAGGPAAGEPAAGEPTADEHRAGSTAAG